MKKFHIYIIMSVLLIFSVSCSRKETSYEALIITGQNTTDWKVSSDALKTMLDQTGLFTTDILQTGEKGADLGSFNPGFSGYDLVVLDYNGDTWTEKTRASFVEFVRNGGGVVVYHSSGNSFSGWNEYTEMCGQRSGTGKKNEHEYEVRTRAADHPVMQGLPARWLHGKDLLYSGLGEPAGNTEILATAYSDTAGGGSGKDEAVLMTNKYGMGRIFQTTMGYPGTADGTALLCAGFITTFQRGAEWAASGNVTQAVPVDFPNAAASVIRQDYKAFTLEDNFNNIINYQIDRSTKHLTGIQNHIRRAAGNPDQLLKIEKMMVEVLKNGDATAESKKLMLRELSWMGSEYCIPAVKELTLGTELKDEAEFALERLKPNQ